MQTLRLGQATLLMPHCRFSKQWPNARLGGNSFSGAVSPGDTVTVLYRWKDAVVLCPALWVRPLVCAPWLFPSSERFCLPSAYSLSAAQVPNCDAIGITPLTP